MKPDQDLAPEAPLEPAADVRPAPGEGGDAASPGAAVPEPLPASERATAGEPPATAADPYLVPALRAAAAAKAAATRIRAGQPDELNGVRARPAWVEGRAPPAGLAEPVGRQAFSVPQAGPPEAAPPSRGLSVAEASAASTLAFRPRSDKAIRPRFRSGYQPLEAEPARRDAASAPAPPAASVAVPPQPRSRWSPAATLGQKKPAAAQPGASDAATAPHRAFEDQPNGNPEAAPSEIGQSAVEPVHLLTPRALRPGGTAANESGGPRFTRTVAELERQQAEKRTLEPWAQMIPRPATPRRDSVVPRDEDEHATGLRALWRRLTGR